MSDTDWTDAISPISEIIEEARNGRMTILVDHEDRENEGDLIIPAQMATPDAVNFMAMHGRGLICLAMPGERVDALGLPLMSSNNRSRHETAFTVSIEAREGVTTGISAHDRAHTIAVAIDPRSVPADIATPGHVFPLRAREGGVLVRAGHTEAAVDIARLAGLTPAGVICEIMKDDGTMARLPDLVAFAQRHGLKIGTISDLIAYRRRHDNLVQDVDEVEITSMIGGTWRLRVFRDSPDGGEHYALIKGRVDDGKPALVRMHVLDPLEDVIALHPERATQVPDSMAAVAAEGRGAVVMLRDSSPTAISDRLRPRTDPGPKQLRQYGVGAQILLNLGITEMILLTNSPAPKVVGLNGYGLSIVETRPIPRRGG
ncbi:3,4-dihydroxy-2-butanone-4-phosphate synthase [Limibaculum sp. M0105]|uniref:3,4-dihydroxy-2-butanone 4-phosphate synthase n=1 Tax=Thermohalobaculum xanthum TaxID=2753746 RepID=A0A8J7SAK1_9RHOB|nr:3,4-dihydroxy-2-butanone-4-phosphate synthase [Thermohalobaculum xanthum]MBK0398387.1 3,4-dihydroxy-2-butanone-4-phosphate synthase [Thermohalobaculum xanthum]